MSFIYLQRVVTVGVICGVLALSACSDTSKEEDNHEQVQALLESKKAAEAAAEKAPAASPESSPAGTIIAKPGEDAGMNLPGNCDASLAQGLVGKELTEEMSQQARQDTRSNKLRVLKPTDGVTLEFDTGRLNIELDEKSVVTTVRCG